MSGDEFSGLLFWVYGLGLTNSRLKRAVWRRSKPEGYKESRLVQGEDGAWYRDMEYEGETAWQDKPAEAVEERVPSGKGLELSWRRGEVLAEIAA